MISPQCTHGIPRCTEHTLYRVITIRLKLNFCFWIGKFERKKIKNRVNIDKSEVFGFLRQIEDSQPKIS